MNKIIFITALLSSTIASAVTLDFSCDVVVNNNRLAGDAGLLTSRNSTQLHFPEGNSIVSFDNQKGTAIQLELLAQDDEKIILNLKAMHCVGGSMKQVLTASNVIILWDVPAVLSFTQEARMQGSQTYVVTVKALRD